MLRHRSVQHGMCPEGFFLTRSSGRAPIMIPARRIVHLMGLVPALVSAAAIDPPPPPPPVTFHPISPYDCINADPQGWSALHKSWCCKKYEGECDSTANPLDCSSINIHQKNEADVWCCRNFHKAGCSSDRSKAAVPQSDSDLWIDFGRDRACRLDKDDSSGDARGSVKYRGAPYNQSVKKCMGLCASLNGVGSHCHGIEYKWGHCELWTRSIGATVGAKHFFCFHYSPAPVTLQGLRDDMFFGVKTDGSIKQGHYIGARDIFHKVRNDDDTVSFLTRKGKFLSAQDSGEVNAESTGVEAWEKFVETAHGHYRYSYRSWQKKYLSVSTHGSLIATSANIGASEKLLVKPASTVTRLFDAEEHPSKELQDSNWQPWSHPWLSNLPISSGLSLAGMVAAFIGVGLVRRATRVRAAKKLLREFKLSSEEELCGE